MARIASRASRFPRKYAGITREKFRDQQHSKAHFGTKWEHIMQAWVAKVLRRTAYQASAGRLQSLGVKNGPPRCSQNVLDLFDSRTGVEQDSPTHCARRKNHVSRAKPKIAGRAPATSEFQRKRLAILRGCLLLPSD